MAKTKWAAFAHPAKAFTYAGEALRKNWERLHRGDREPYPKEPDVQEAWRLFHQGRFAEAMALGLKAGEEHFRKALELAPDCPIAYIETANGLVMMHGKKALAEAASLYAKAAKFTPRDAMEKLDVEAARAELE